MKFLTLVCTKDNSMVTFVIFSSYPTDIVPIPRPYTGSLRINH